MLFRSVSQSRYYDGVNVLTHDQRKKLINFQYFNDTASDHTPTNLSRLTNTKGNTRLSRNPYFQGSYVEFDLSEVASGGTINEIE